MGYSIAFKELASSRSLILPLGKGEFPAFVRQLRHAPVLLPSYLVLTVRAVRAASRGIHEFCRSVGSEGGCEVRFRILLSLEMLCITATNKLTVRFVTAVCCGCNDWQRQQVA
jgi:hypothetical protein